MDMSRHFRESSERICFQKMVLSIISRGVGKEEEGDLPRIFRIDVLSNCRMHDGARRSRKMWIFGSASLPNRWQSQRASGNLPSQIEAMNQSNQPNLNPLNFLSQHTTWYLAMGEMVGVNYEEVGSHCERATHHNIHHVRDRQQVDGKQSWYYVVQDGRWAT